MAGATDPTKGEGTKAAAGTMANTGGASAVWIVAGVLLVGAGTTIIVMRRRRNDS